MKTYIVRKLEVGDNLGETHGLRLTHGVYADEEGLREAVALCYNETTAEEPTINPVGHQVSGSVALCYNETTAEELCDLLNSFERECCGMDDDG